jgi:predicted ATP-binding protein involved in virulence
VYIKNLTLQNYRGALYLDINLHSKLNVFYGVNGSGKSTVLDASAIMLSWVVNRIRHAGVSGRPIMENDISNGKSISLLYLDCVCTDESQIINWKLVKSRRGYSNANKRSIFSELNQFTEDLRDKITESNEQVNLPLFAYYPVNRAVLDIPLRIKEKHSFNFLSAYDDSLTGGANFKTFFEWFREREDLENENRRYKDQLFKPDDFQFPDPQLEAVRHALEQLMPEFKNLTVRRNPLRMEVEKNGQRLTVNQLSDGEKCLMAMVGDLARRMAIANPVRDNPLDGEGIILIDEIDLHLHPKWQRMIVPKLLELFPNCQFIVSTHSPHVLTHVRSESLYLLKQEGHGMVAEHPSESYGKNVDRVLEDLMGLETTRPDQVSNELHLLYSEINQGKLSKARQTIKKMRSEIGDDPELVKAEVLIKRKEIIGK